MTNRIEIDGNRIEAGGIEARTIAAGAPGPRRGRRIAGTRAFGTVAAASALLLSGCANAGPEQAPVHTEQHDEQGQGDAGSGETGSEQDDLASMTFDVSWQDAVSTASAAFDGRLISVELDRERGEWAYSIELASDAEEYDATVSASSGEILGDRTEPLDAEVPGEVIDTGGLITPEAAMGAATAEVDGAVRSWSLDRDRRGVSYEVEIAAAGGGSRDVTVDAKSGDVVEVDD